LIKCKACSASVNVSEQEIDEMLNKIISGNQFQIAAEEIYENRLDKCFSCNYLQYGTTCMQCGCIVQIRAKLKDSTCPYPKLSRW
jgi:membrane protease subunit (stomatin/prohibitin family)